MEDKSVRRSFPSINTFPLLGGNRPLRMEIVVVLPAPLGPSNPKISFLLIEKDIPSTAGSEAFLNVFVKFCISIIAGLFISFLLHPQKEHGTL
jgi:hypothetical protein